MEEFANWHMISIKIFRRAVPPRCDSDVSITVTLDTYNVSSDYKCSSLSVVLTNFRTLLTIFPLSVTTLRRCILFIMNLSPGSSFVPALRDDGKSKKSTPPVTDRTPSQLDPFCSLVIPCSTLSNDSSSSTFARIPP